MTVSLRERRRRQTAREIQIATLELALQQGLENVTTEEIAASAGVSTRTFFNYYANKEAAAVGTPPPFQKEDKQALRDGAGALADDIKRFLDQYMKALAEDEPILRMMGPVMRSNEKARGILEGFLVLERDELTECLGNRVSDRQTAAALAAGVTGAIGRAIQLWNRDPDLSLDAALDTVWKGLIAASQLLATPQDP
ncbi:TetR/AcrR family transcriptional regulator [Primorskyibacter sedentarius]|uniref:TetR/AcrR family transcriptional regulator n=1 Tax=Primorskyibacter sedentarius TaxID=745311 RepID=UPI003EBDB6EB